MKSLLKFAVLIAIILLSPDICLRAQSFDWVKGGGSTHIISSGSTRESSYFICCDQNGNTYTLNAIGNTGPIIADTFSRPSAFGNDENVLLTSHNCNGEMRFAKLISGWGSRMYGIATDSVGHLYVALFCNHGSTSSTFLRIGSDTTITGVVNQTQLLIQFDTTGAFNWLRFVGDNSTATILGALSYGSGLVVDKQNNVHFVNTMKFGVPITPSIISQMGSYDLTYDVGGNLISVKKLRIDSTLHYIGGITLNKSDGTLFAYGSRQYSMFPDSSRHPYIAAFDTDRNLVWMDTLADNTNLAVFSGITCDNSNYVYLTGGTVDWVSYRGDTVTQELPGAVSFILKIDTGGNPKWLKGFSGANSVNNLLNPSLTSNGNVVAGGAFRTKVVSGSDTLIEFPGETQNAHFVVLDTAGYIDSHHQLHGFGSLDGIMCSATDRKGNIYLAGEVSNNIWAGALSPYTSVGGNSDYFVMKYGVDCNCTSAPVAHYADTGYLVRGFSYTGTTTPAIDSVRWYFGDGGTSTMLNPTHTYTTADTFNARVRVYTSCGSDLYCKEVRIPCITAPGPTFTMSGTGLTRTFSYIGTTTGVTSISWSYSDGGSGSGTSSNHTFSAAGTYTVCVSATNPCGTTTTCNPVTITCTSSPVSAFTVSAGAGLSKTFTYTGTTTGMDSVTWTFGDGGTATGSGPLHTYASAGTYTVCATVYTNCGVHTVCNPIIVTCITGPTAAYSYTGSDLSRSFSYTGTTAGMDSVRWNFGDGVTTSVLSPSHTFSAAGTYTVCVTVYTNCGSHTYCSAVTVTCIVPPVASFTISGSGSSRTYTYTGTTAGMDSVRWNFGDGGTSALLNPSHTYATEDTFHVCVTVYTNCGSHTSCLDAVVACFLPVISAFTDTGMLMHGFTYTGTTAGLDSVKWTFGDGYTGSGTSITHTYAVADTYTVCATVYTNCGTHTSCRDIIIIIIIGSSAVSTLYAADIKVYPNPATNELFITGITEQMEYRVMNVVGVTIKNGVLGVGSAWVDVAQLSAGVYVLQLTDGYGRRVVVRFVKG